MNEWIFIRVRICGVSRNAEGLGLFYFNGSFLIPKLINLSL